MNPGDAPLYAPWGCEMRRYMRHKRCLWRMGCAFSAPKPANEPTNGPKNQRANPRNRRTNPTVANEPEGTECRSQAPKASPKEPLGPSPPPRQRGRAPPAPADARERPERPRPRLDRPADLGYYSLTHRACGRSVAASRFVPPLRRRVGHRRPARPRCRGPVPGRPGGPSNGCPGRRLR
jgi:hypothetical protein